jgi:hypothetical protein
MAILAQSGHSVRESEKVAVNQRDQIGLIFAQLAIFTLGSFSKTTEVAHIFGLPFLALKAMY